MKKYEKQEYTVYIVLWLGVLAVPLVNAYGKVALDLGTTTNFMEVVHTWIMCLPFFVAFLIHNFLIAPQLVRYQRRWLYGILLCVLLCLLSIEWPMPMAKWQAPNAIEMGGTAGGPPPMEGIPPAGGNNPANGASSADDAVLVMPSTPLQMAFTDSIGRAAPPLPTNDERDAFTPQMMEREVAKAGEKADDNPPEPREMPTGGAEFMPNGKPGFDPHMDDQKDMLVNPRTTVFLLVGFLVMALNLGVKYYFKSERKSKEVDEARRQKLEEQLKYLKYQISPHFFMNTLNNIFVLVDARPEQAKVAILELSKMMRYILYEADRDYVPLRHEAALLNGYVSLMKLRYTDKVTITGDIPEDLPDYGVPPLLLVCFVENAFKHGISYKRDSFVNIRVRVEGDRLHFACINSIPPATSQKSGPGGVGLANVKRRLTLIYGKDYTLDIRSNEDEYYVVLDMPLKTVNFNSPPKT
ncbi:MAG: histidine kinase [Bacteroidales bacterium]|nr:histidine kinase [Bacteroidales bacterium]